MKVIKYERWQNANQKAVNSFYKSHKQNVSCQQADAIYVAKYNTISNEKNDVVNDADIKSIKDSTVVGKLVAVNDKYRDKDEIIAVAFIRDIPCQSQTIHLFRSLFVAPQYRGQGIAQQLLRYLLKDTLEQSPNRPLTLLCKPHLTDLYVNAGFFINDSENAIQSPYIHKLTLQNHIILSTKAPK